jgi:3-methyladenine DNA glycosylase AlkD
MSKLLGLRKELKNLADPVRAKHMQRYFKTGKGEYGEGDVFLGLTVPTSRKLAKKYTKLSFKGIGSMLASKFHEERLIALLILVQKFNKGDEKKQKEVYEFYLNNTDGINNWDLVDLSSHEIVGKYLLSSTRSLNNSSAPSGNTNLAYDGASNLPAVSSYLRDSKRTMKNQFREESNPEEILFRLAKSKNIWERRIACISTFEFIRKNRFEISIKLAEMLINDKHDLMHKAVGWMLREVGKKDLKTEIKFLDKYYKKMPRTMLRYAIEKFPEKQRLAYLKKD